jgi:hypothetical protein
VPLHLNVQPRPLGRRKSGGMPNTNVDVLYVWDGSVRSEILTLPLRHAENAFAWLQAHFPEVEVLDTRKSLLQ